ncbi:hypothetical protein [Anaerosphaera aminiphila]|uniref:hypothetical protein n=1 Tax=Anaerosphaera aminiphila TaxID=1120994 RepID=UPI0011782DAA|nr:hypothetical protein [Anaerosphaera aminiphila]
MTSNLIQFTLTNYRKSLYSYVSQISRSFQPSLSALGKPDIGPTTKSKISVRSLEVNFNQSNFVLLGNSCIKSMTEL